MRWSEVAAMVTLGGAVGRRVLGDDEGLYGFALAWLVCLCGLFGPGAASAAGSVQTWMAGLKLSGG